MNRINTAILLLSLSSCCWTLDSTVPSGYPFNSSDMELNFIIYKSTPDWVGPNYFKDLSYLDSTYVDDTVTCNSLFREIDPNYNCNIDFEKYSLVYASGYVDQVFEYKFQNRVLINHKQKTYTVEMRAYTKTCNSGLNSNYNNYYIRDFMLVPKIPKGYFYKLEKYSPVK